MDSDKRIGLVGAKLIHPDGRLRECGGIVWSDGTGWSLGRDGDPDACEHNVLRDVDYCSGAALLVRAEAFHRVGGFDTRYALGCYEDIDLAFALRTAGYRTVVQPKVVVVGHEGVSHGIGTTGSAKRYRERNRRAFVDKWSETLVAEHLAEPTPRALWLARHRGTRGHFGPIVLFEELQVPDWDSGTVRTRRILE